MGQRRTDAELDAMVAAVRSEGGSAMTSEPTVETTADLQAALSRVSFVNTVLDFKWRFECRAVDVLPCWDDHGSREGWLVWASFERPDSITGQVGRGRGREEIVWRGTPLSGVVKTAWLLVELLVRHELMEGFRFDDVRIFNPHNSVLDLKRVPQAHDAAR